MLNFGIADMLHYVREMEIFGVATVESFLPPPVRSGLLRELERFVFVREDEQKGPYGVRQEFEAVTCFPSGSLFLSVRDEVQGWINEAAEESVPDCFPGAIALTELVVQRYEPGPVGISAHRDGKSFVNVVAILVLEGQGRFCVCDTRDGANPRPIRNEPGDLLLMRAPGFLGSDHQPFHFVDQITSRRTTFSLRQRKPAASPAS